jgi:hypothetical protein
MKQIILAVNQLINTFVWSSYDKENFEYGFGRADETISARLWRLNDKSTNWKFVQGVVDTVFEFFGESDHTYKAWVAELQRRHLPPPYQEFLDLYQED